MRVCIIAEGCYPYVVGGVSSWIHSMIRSFPEHEFIVLAILANRTFSGKFAYELPENLKEVYELYLEDKDWVGGKGRHYKKMTKPEYEALTSLLMNQNVKWGTLFKYFSKKDLSLNDVLMGTDFFRAVREVYQLNYTEIVFSDFLWTMRSIYLPLFLTMQMDMPKADLYHCVATGYAGVLGCMAKHKYPSSGLLVSEHGIYTREREEELIRAAWVEGIYKNVWIEQFKKMSRLAYGEAQLVTSLYEHARELQIELGCPEEITMVTPNGIDVNRFVLKPDRIRTTEEDMIHVAAVIRVTPIKDVKTLIRAFAFAKENIPALKLWIMGPTDEEPEYAQECMELVDAMAVKDIVFTGRVNVTDYLWQMDMTILTSISEGQPLTILEGFAAHKPAIATDVGNCRGLLYGEGDDSFGDAGILTHVMNVEEISAAIMELAGSREKRERMGENGYMRVMARYKIEDMKNTYKEIYHELGIRT